MNFKKLIKKILYPKTYSSEAYVNYLKASGCKVGNNTYFYDPKSNVIDNSRPEFIEIGSNCQITKGVIILAHDYSYSVLRNIYHNIMPTSSVTKIGNNVFIGMNSIILMNSEIGDNVIIGAGSVVKGKIPNGTIWAGNPAKQISTIEKYRDKLEKNLIENARVHARRIIEIKNRNPTIKEMGYYSWIFTDKTSYERKACAKGLPFYGDFKPEAELDYIELNNVYTSFEEFLQDL